MDPYIVLYWGEASAITQAVSAFHCIATGPDDAVAQFRNAYPTREHAWVKCSTSEQETVHEYNRWLYL
jgi:hypothetical protein